MTMIDCGPWTEQWALDGAVGHVESAIDSLMMVMRNHSKEEHGNILVGVIGSLVVCKGQIKVFKEFEQNQHGAA